MKPIKLLLLLLALFGCGISPQQATEGLEASLASEDWCGFKAPDPATLVPVAVVDHSADEVEKAFNHPDGYGLTGTYGCFEADEEWPGGFCWAPGTRYVTGRIYADGQDATWVDAVTSEWLSWKNRLNARGWSVTQVTSGAATMNVHTDMATGPGVLAESLQNTWTLHTGFDQGDYWTYAKCDVLIHRARIEANTFYQAAASTQKTKYKRNVYDHEDEHCAGLAHSEEEDLLMSAVYHFPGPRFDDYLNPTGDELQMIDDFLPFD